MYDRILLPTDGSEHTERAIEHALDIAETRSATLHVLSIVDDRAFLVLDDERVDEVRADLKEKAHEAVAAAQRQAKEHSLEVTSDVDVGNPAERIVAYVESEDIDLVVMGTSGDDYERNVVGSVSERVVATSPAPVLTVGMDTRD